MKKLLKIIIFIGITSMPAFADGYIYFGAGSGGKSSPTTTDKSPLVIGAIKYYNQGNFFWY